MSKIDDELKYWTKTGTVIDVENSSATNIHGGGGQNNSAVHISSTTTTKMHLFVRQDDGTEFDASFYNSSVAVRPGHRVSTVSVGRKVDNIGYVVGLAVHDTGKNAVSPTRAEKFVGRINNWLGAAMVIIIPIIVETKIGNWNNGGYWLFSVLAIGGFLIFRNHVSNNRRDTIVKGASAELNKAVEQEKARANAA